jgi:hypothetical protein
MSFDDSLRRYRAGLFTDADVTSSAGLSVRAWRELIKIGAVRTISATRGRGRVRLCDHVTMKRAAVIAALNSAGFSLAVSGRIAYYLPLDMFLYQISDPNQILFQNSVDVDPMTGLPRRVQQPKTDWFDPDRPAKPEPEYDWLIEIFEARFVTVSFGLDDGLSVYGDLRDEGTTFVCWFPAHRLYNNAADEAAATGTSPVAYKSLAKWESPMDWADQLDARFLDYKFEDHSADDDPLATAAGVTLRSPIFKTSVNASLAVRKAVRRYLGIEPMSDQRKEG